jgi:predicted DNA-binding transcriptional regulator YafY
VSREVLGRQLRLVEILHEYSFGKGDKSRGVRTRRLAQSLGVSRATLYRYIDDLVAVGVPITSSKTASGTLYRLESSTLPSLQLTHPQLLALRLARKRMEPFRGTRGVRELDALLSKFSGPVVKMTIDDSDVPADTDADLVRLADDALRTKHRLQFYYEPGNSEPGIRTVDPLQIKFKDKHLFLVAFDVHKKGVRTFKFLRMKDARILPEQADLHPEFDPDAVDEGTVKVWQAPLCDVAIWIAASKARYVREWRLHPDQQVEKQSDGAVIVRARVAGTQETLKWVQSWGGAVRVLEPPELRQAHLEDLRAGLAQYE